MFEIAGLTGADPLHSVRTRSEKGAGSPIATADTIIHAAATNKKVANGWPALCGVVTIAIVNMTLAAKQENQRRFPGKYVADRTMIG